MSGQQRPDAHHAPPPAPPQLAGLRHGRLPRLPLEKPPAGTPRYCHCLPPARRGYQLRIAGIMPVVIGPALFAACPERQRWELVRSLAVHAAFFCALRGLPMPRKTGRFVECGDEFILEDEIDPYGFARLRVPRRSVVAGA